MGGITKNGVRIWSVGKKPLPLHPHKAQMAESVDALVSNTSGETRPGSTPGLGTQEAARKSKRLILAAFCLSATHSSPADSSPDKPRGLRAHPINLGD